MSEERFEVVVLSAVENGSHPNGLVVTKGDVTSYLVVQGDVEYVKKQMKNGHDSEAFSVAVFPVNRNAKPEEQKSRAKTLCNYLNKILDEQKRVIAGAEMGFLK